MEYAAQVVSAHRPYLGLSLASWTSRPPLHLRNSQGRWPKRLQTTLEGGAFKVMGPQTCLKIRRRWIFSSPEKCTPLSEVRVPPEVTQACPGFSFYPDLVRSCRRERSSTFLRGSRESPAGRDSPCGTGPVWPGARTLRRGILQKALDPRPWQTQAAQRLAFGASPRPGAPSHKVRGCRERRSHAAGALKNPEALGGKFARRPGPQHEPVGSPRRQRQAAGRTCVPGRGVHLASPRPFLKLQDPLGVTTLPGHPCTRAPALPERPGEGHAHGERETPLSFPGGDPDPTDTRKPPATPPPEATLWDKARDK